MKISFVFSYEFQVKYTDADGDLPRYVFVYINGSKMEMTKADISDNDSKDGILYTLQMSEEELSKLAPKVGEWEIDYWFRTNDGKGPVRTENSDLFAFNVQAMGLLATCTSGSGESSSGSSGCGCGR